MATPSFASHDMLARLDNAGADGDDKMREILKAALPHLIAVQAAVAIGADQYERTEERIRHRSGSLMRTLDTGAGRVNLSTLRSQLQLLPEPAGAASPDL